MRIKLDKNHVLESDAYNIWISSVEKTSTGKERFVNETGYYQDIKQLFDDYKMKRCVASNAESFEELIKEVKSTSRKISKWADAINSAVLNKDRT